MDFTRKLSLHVGLVLVAMAITAPAATALFEVKTESDGIHCGAEVSVTSHEAEGGCAIHIVGTEALVLSAHINGHTSEIALSSCTVEFEGRIDEGGLGYMYNQVLSDASPSSCVVEGCEEGGTGALETWPFEISEVGTANEISMAICVQAKGMGVEGVPCTVQMPITNLGHVYTIDGEPELGCDGVGDERELDGRFSFENNGEGAHSTVELLNEESAHPHFTPETGEKNFNHELKHMKVIFTSNYKDGKLYTQKPELSGDRKAHFKVDKGCDGEELAYTEKCTLEITPLVGGDETKEARVIVHYKYHKTLGFTYSSESVHLMK